LTDSEGYGFSDVAVFYRTNAQSRVIEETLVRAGHPYRVVGGVRFYDRREAKDSLAYLRALVNPDDEVGWRRLVNVPKRGVGDSSVSKVGAYAQGRALTSRDALDHADAAGVSGKALSGIRDLLDILAEVEGAAGTGVAPVVQAVLEDTGYLAELEAERSIEAEARLENLQELIGVCREFDDALEAGGGRRARRHGERQRRRRNRRRPLGPRPRAGVPGGRLARDRSRRHRGRQARRHPDDPPLRQGPRVPGGVPDRARGRRVPAHAQPRRAGRARGGAAAVLRGHHARPRASLSVPRVEPHALRSHRLLPAEPVPVRDPRGARRCSR